MKLLMDLVSNSSTAVQVAVAVGAVVVSGLVLKKLVGSRRSKLRPKEVSETPRLYIFPKWALGPNASPGCVKLETFLRLAKIKYTVNAEGKTGPTGRWPYISHKGEFISDSGTCIEYLIKEMVPGFDDHLSPRDKALGLLLTRTFEQSTYFGIVRIRWVDNIESYIKVMNFGGMPDWIKALIMKNLRKGVIKVLNGQGCGDRSDTEYIQDIQNECAAIMEFLPTDPTKYFGNYDRPSSLDAVLYAYLHSLWVFPYSRRPRFMETLSAARVQRYLSLVETNAFPEGFGNAQSKGSVN
jgi:hypothetical protein